MSLRLKQIWCVLITFVLALSCACTTTSPPPPLIESIQRLPLKTIQVDGDQITYVDTGSGHPLILIHGLGGAIWNWEHQYMTLSSCYRVIALDLLGSGMSAKPDIRYTPSRLVTFFLHFMESLKISQATLIGNSMGAGLAMGIAITDPDRVKALVLISGFPLTLKGTIHSTLYQRYLEHRPPLWLAKIGNWLSGRWATRMVLEEIVFDHTLLTSSVIERSYQNRKRDDVLTPLYSLLENMDEWDQQYAPRIAEIQQPTLILWGEEDQVFRPRIGQKILEQIAQPTWHLIPNAGHFLQWEKPEQVNSLILDFLVKIANQNIPQARK